MMKKKIVIALICVLSVASASLILYFVRTSTWYHWKEIDELVKNPKTFIESSQEWSICNPFPYKTPEGKFNYHINKLIERGEIKYQEFSFDKKVSYDELMGTIKKSFPDLIWMQLQDHKDIVSDKNNGYLLKFWANPQTMERFKKFYQSYSTAN